MKRKLLNLLSAVMICSLAAAFTSCNGDEPSGGVDTQLLDALTRGEETVCYRMSEYNLYQNTYENPGAWNKINLSELIGWSASLPEVINVSEGRSWKPLEMFSCGWGPSELALPLYAYRKVTGFDKQFYITSQFAYNEEKGTLLLDGKECKVEEATSQRLRLSCCRTYYKNTGTGGPLEPMGEFKEVLNYTVETLSLPELDKIVYYDSEFDAFMAMLEMIREEFGDEFNINPYLAPNIILDDLIINLNDIEKRLRERYNR